MTWSSDSHTDRILAVVLRAAPPRTAPPCDGPAAAERRP
jgi:hypothetical protein